jgi:type VI secretion system secreted protein VgrG
MQTPKANEAHFVFLCGNLKASTFNVVDFIGHDSISSPYDFSITLTSSSSDIKADDVINKQATLFIYRDGEYFPYSGIVSEFRFLDRSVAASTYSVRLVPRLWLLCLNIQTRIFQKMSVDDIIKKVFNEANLSNYFKLSLNNKYPEREYVVQYQESDLNFVSRLMEEAGIWYLFKESPLLPKEVSGVGAETMIISDKPDSFKDIDGEAKVIFRAHSGLTEQIDDEDTESVNKISCDRRVISQNIFVKNYNYRTPEVDISSKSTVKNGDVGTVYKYGGNFKKTDEAKKKADVLAEQIGTGHTVMSGRGNCRGFRAGKRFTLSQHFRSDCNDTFLIRHVVHMGAHALPRGGRNVFTYSNDFAALPSANIDSFRPAQKSVIPRISGVISAAIEAKGSDYAAIDDMGRYKVRMPFDISDAKNSEGSKYIRLAQPYSGSEYGIHFPSHEGAEMLLACIDGDPDKPVGVGTVPHANTVSPVISKNKEQSVIKTAGGNEIILDDTADKQKITIKTNGKNLARLDDEAKQILVQTTDGNFLDIDDTNKRMNLSVQKKHVINLAYGGDPLNGILIMTDKGHRINIDDDGKMLSIETSGGHTIQLDDQGKKMILSDGGKNTVTLDKNKGLILDTKGKLSINATQDIEVKGANIKMSTTTGKIDVKATQDLSLSGLKINEKATTDFNMEGLNVNTKASLNAKTEANLGVEIKSNLQTKVSGTMAELSGSAMTTIKGGIVMIN